MGNNAREKAQRKKKKQKMQPLKAQTGAFHDRSRSGVRKGSSSSKPMAMAGGAHRSQRACPSPTVPFDASHRILLVGEGCGSLASSLPANSQWLFGSVFFCFFLFFDLPNFDVIVKR